MVQLLEMSSVITVLSLTAESKYCFNSLITDRITKIAKKKKKWHLDLTIFIFSLHIRCVSVFKSVDVDVDPNREPK